MEAQSHPVVEGIAIALSDRPALEAASRTRLLHDYDPEPLRCNPYVPPPNVARGLLHPESAAHLAQVAQAAGVENLHLLLIRQHLCLPGGTLYPLPLHVTLSWSHRSPAGEEYRIAGPVFVSALHNLPRSISADYRQQIITDYVGTYLRQSLDVQVTLIGIPYRAPEGPTHQAFAALAIPHPASGDLVETVVRPDGTPAGNRYYFPHGAGAVQDANCARGQQLMLDAQVRRQLAALGQAWSENIEHAEHRVSHDVSDLYTYHISATTQRLLAAWYTQHTLQPGLYAVSRNRLIPPAMMQGIGA